MVIDLSAQRRLPGRLQLFDREVALFVFSWLLLPPRSFPSPSVFVTSMAQTPTLLQFSGHQYLRHRLVISILSGKPIRIDKIRSDDKNPGLRGKTSCLSVLKTSLEQFNFFPDYEISLLRLLERITNGTVIEISVTGE